MQTDNRLFDDLARLASGAVGALQGVKGELDGLVRRELERVLNGMELVSRDEFEAVKAMAAAARLENERLSEQIAALEARLAGADGTRADGAGA
jgi:BMFP domain-containing protein YqiC